MKIAILSNGPGNYSTKRLKEEAESRGHEVDIIKYKNAYISIDEKNPKVIYEGGEIERYDVVIPRIASYMTNMAQQLCANLRRNFRGLILLIAA